jgi:MFS family permease
VNVSGLGFKNSLASILLVANAFIWYLYTGRLLAEVTLNSGFTSYQVAVVWGMNILGTAAASILGLFVSSKVENRITFLQHWLLAGIPLSLLPAVINLGQLNNLILFFTFVGVYFGLGMPVTLAYFAEVTDETNRSRLGGITFLTIFAGVFLLGTLGIADITLNAVVLAFCKVAGMAVILTVKPVENAVVHANSGSCGSILTNKAFILYFVPWIMFSIANYIGLPIVSQIFPSLFEHSMMIENLIAGIFAVISGFFGDYIGRKRLVVSGFILLGLGYASLGLFPENIVGWWFYTAVDGLAWGIFYTIFLMTIWGDIAHGENSEKYYAIGYLPFLVSIFTELSLGTSISSTVNTTAIFSFTSIFLFLAVLPLAYAPETLPQRVFENRELENYVEQAQRARLRSQSREK